MLHNLPNRNMRFVLFSTRCPWTRNWSPTLGLSPGPTLSQGKGYGDYWALPWLCWISTVTWMIISLWHWLAQMLVWCVFHWLVQNRHNQESAQVACSVLDVCFWIRNNKSDTSRKKLICVVSYPFPWFFFQRQDVGRRRKTGVKRWSSQLRPTVSYNQPRQPPCAQHALPLCSRAHKNGWLE